MFREELRGELPLVLNDEKIEEVKNYIINYLSYSYKSLFKGYLEVEDNGYPGIIAYVDSDRGPLLEFHIIFLKEKVRYLVRLLDPTASLEVMKKASRVIERCLLSYWETGGKGNIYFVYVPGRKIVPPRMERGIKSALQKLFLGNMIFLFAISILISYIVYLIAGPYITPIVLLLSQIPLIFTSHKIIALIMGDWNIDSKHKKVYLVGLELPLEKFNEIMSKTIYPLRYKIKKKIYEETLEKGLQLKEESVKEVLEKYGLKSNNFRVNIRELNIYDMVSSIVEKFNVRKPKIYISNIIIPNAAASGVSSRFSTMILTTGLLTRLNENELKAVIGHEISHLKRHDILTFFILSSVEYISRVLVSLMLWPLLLGFLDFIILMMYMYTSLTLLFFVAKFVEARADIDSAKRLGAAHDLASALRKIAMRKLIIEQRHESRLPFWLSWNPHPPVSFRIEMLEKAHLRYEVVSSEWKLAISSCVKDFIESIKEAII